VGDILRGVAQKLDFLFWQHFGSEFIIERCKFSDFKLILKREDGI